MSDSGLGLGGANGFIRQPPPMQGATDRDSIEVLLDDGELPDRPATDDHGNILRIEHGDGTITVSLTGNPLGNVDRESAAEWFGNLVDEIDSGELYRIADDLLRGIDEDIRSRQEWIDDRAEGIKLLGLKIEVPGLQGSADGAPVEGMSKVRHPLLLEAVLRFQANARAELLPTDGPVKIRVDASNGGTTQEDQLANALEKDMNHYLTSIASEYYPDTDRMLLMLGFGGSSFKKVYFCPLRGRPVSESVDADDLIVNYSATDLQNAKRVTHRVMMNPNTVRRLQIMGVYRDVDLPDAMQTTPDAVQQAKDDQQGKNPAQTYGKDRDREIFECYCELDIQGFEHQHKGRPSGLEIPYIVTIDKSAREILNIRRNYREDDQVLPTAIQRFVKYTFVPGLGFYDIGLLHILGNTTNAVTAAWRELLDAGMFASFPGFLIADVGARQNTNIFRVPPGGAALVKTGNLPLGQAVMPLPYKEPSPALMGLVQNMAETGQRIGGTSEQMVGEGRADAPVGTTLAMIEQAAKLLNSVHKRMHASQAREFQLLMDVFKEHPESFIGKADRRTTAWNEAQFLRALNDFDLVPQADPNTSSHVQRIMKVQGLLQLYQAAPNMFDPIAVVRTAMNALGWSNPDQFMAPISAMGAPPPEVAEKQAALQIKNKEADTKRLAVQLKAAELQGRDATQDSQAEILDAHAKMLAAQTKAKEVDVRAAQAAVDGRDRDLDRQSRERMQAIQLAKDILTHPETAAGLTPLLAGLEGGNEPG